MKAFKEKLKAYGLFTYTAYTTEHEIILINQVSDYFWPSFSKSHFFKQKNNPLDRWSQSIIDTCAKQTIHKPFIIKSPSKGPPYAPFLTWALQNKQQHPSKLGPLIDDEYGLWHAFRGAVIIDNESKQKSNPTTTDSPCSTCKHDCFSPCPVGAFTNKGFNPKPCRSYLKIKNNRCQNGCLARLSCPIGKQYQYKPIVQQFFLNKFAKLKYSQ